MSYFNCFWSFSPFLSFSWGLQADVHESDSKDDSGKGRILWTVPRHPAQFHEGHPGREHQLCGVWEHALQFRYPKVGRSHLRAKRMLVHIMKPEQILLLSHRWYKRVFGDVFQYIEHWPSNQQVSLALAVHLGNWARFQTHSKGNWYFISLYLMFLFTTNQTVLF